MGGYNSQQVNLIERAVDDFESAIQLMVWRDNGAVPKSETTNTQIHALIEQGVRNTAALAIAAVQDQVTNILTGDS